MNEGDTVLDVLNEIVKASIKPVTSLTGVEEARRKALNLVYRERPKIRSFIDVCMMLYTRAVIEGKEDILLDGIGKLSKMVFDIEPMESDTTAPQKK